jgi:hypothetical protein
MKIRKSILTATTGVLLAAFGGMALASPTPQKPSSSTATKQALPTADHKSATSVSRGTITSIDKDRLVLTHKAKNGKAEELTFMLNSKTERKGDLTPGSRVRVHYTTENNQLIATVIQAMPEKTASNAKKPVVTK